MSTRRSRLLKAGALLPLAAVSVAWTASIAGVGGPGLALADRQQPGPVQAVLPDGTSLPSSEVEAPASVTAGAGSLGAVSGNAEQIVSTASTSGIPSVALAAYQRAESVINAADTTCQMPWQLVAAIGRVESNHGRANGNVLGDDGLATPGIYGVPLDGTAGVALINDTDGGQYDADASLDRAVGPLQFIPSTWSVVGVDADGDGKRDPQDVNDAALGAAVYLCSGDDDLSTRAGQEAAVLRYNNSQSYVDLVLSVMQAYMSGDFTTIPNSTVAAGVIVADPGAVAGSAEGGRDKIVDGKGSGTKTKPSTKPTPTVTPTPSPTPQPSPTPDGGDKGGNGGGKQQGNGGNSGGNANGGGNSGNGGVQVPLPGGGSATVPALPSTGATPVDQVLTVAQATIQCTADGFNSLTDAARFQQCIRDYTGQ